MRLATPKRRIPRRRKDNLRTSPIRCSNGAPLKAAPFGERMPRLNGTAVGESGSVVVIGGERFTTPAKIREAAKFGEEAMNELEIRNRGKKKRGKKRGKMRYA